MLSLRRSASVGPWRKSRARHHPVVGQEIRKDPATRAGQKKMGGVSRPLPDLCVFRFYWQDSSWAEPSASTFQLLLRIRNGTVNVVLPSRDDRTRHVQPRVSCRLRIADGESTQPWHANCASCRSREGCPSRHPVQSQGLTPPTSPTGPFCASASFVLVTSLIFRFQGLPTLLASVSPANSARARVAGSRRPCPCAQ
jgi:hypothetical protein